MLSGADIRMPLSVVTRHPRFIQLNMLSSIHQVLSDLGTRTGVYSIFIPTQNHTPTRRPILIQKKKIPVKFCNLHKPYFGIRFDSSYLSKADDFFDVNDWA